MSGTDLSDITILFVFGIPTLLMLILWMESRNE